MFDMFVGQGQLSWGEALCCGTRRPEDNAEGQLVMQNSDTPADHPELSPKVRPPMTKRPGKLRRRSSSRSTSSSNAFRFESDVERFHDLSQRLSGNKSNSPGAQSDESVTLRNSLLAHSQALSHGASSLRAELQKLSPESKAQLRAEAMKSMPSLPVPMQIQTYLDESRRIALLPSDTDRVNGLSNLQWGITHNLATYGPSEIIRKYNAFRAEVARLPRDEQQIFESALLNSITCLPRSERLNAFYTELLRIGRTGESPIRIASLRELKRAVAKSIERFPADLVTAEYRAMQAGIAQLPQADQSLFVDALLDAFSSLPNHDIGLTFLKGKQQLENPAYTTHHTAAFFSNLNLIQGLRKTEKLERLLILKNQLPYLHPTEQEHGNKKVATALVATATRESSDAIYASPHDIYDAWRTRIRTGITKYPARSLQVQMLNNSNPMTYMKSVPQEQKPDRLA